MCVNNYQRCCKPGCHSWFNTKVKFCDPLTADHRCGKPFFETPASARDRERGFRDTPRAGGMGDGIIGPNSQGNYQRLEKFPIWCPQCSQQSDDPCYCIQYLWVCERCQFTETARIMGQSFCKPGHQNCRGRFQAHFEPLTPADKCGICTYSTRGLTTLLAQGVPFSQQPDLNRYRSANPHLEEIEAALIPTPQGHLEEFPMPFVPIPRMPDTGLIYTSSPGTVLLQPL